MKLFTTSSIQLRDFFHGGRLLISNKQGFLFYQQLRSEYPKLDNHQLFEILNEVADEENLEHYWASAKTQKVIPSKEIIEPKTFKECYGRTKKEAEDRQYAKILEWAKSQKGGV
ncbi:hypothetical protein P3535_17740 [Vibrio parahaemolyticus]|uniref:hypothetical protein n=1 Tax=Vibrio parahaemolyticus TaxID=670 RepID=UPI0018696E2F|nr:hypothetical protein [Vibrio parahaemolyticus]MBE4433875.1 hypothetical protein [Vibrio parahaemolyticus]MDF4814367.1 hypothetical protein [Vibrio parahaemolyticus]MDF4829385.1 hypothetical protein [Vibrio parahaemolyticus]MDF4834150.1 hypothetical protein [Vibrio parahaemolyticus]MEA5338445.1 hypothetical protein [Vibrio parahaemolyticus]